MDPIAGSKGMREPTIDLHLYFSGLMVFKDGNDGVEALVVDARSPGRIPGTEAAEIHQAVVQFAWDQAVGDKRPFGNFKDADRQKKGYWILDRDVVEVAPGAGAQTGDSLVRSFAPLQGKTPTEDNASSLEWVAPLQGTGGDPGELKEDQILRANEGPLVATVKLKRGNLAPAGFAAETSKFVISQFPSGRQQAMASVLEVQERVRGSSVCLSATKFDGSSGETLELVPSPGSDRIEIWVLNREWAAIVDQRPSRAVASEFLYFHDLLINPPAVVPQVADRLAGNGVPPAIRPCLDSGMLRLYFSQGGGELSLHAPCSPAFV